VQRVKQHRVHGRVASFSRLFFRRRLLLLVVFVFFFVVLFRATVDVPGEHVPEFLLLSRLRALFSHHCYGILVFFVRVFEKQQFRKPGLFSVQVVVVLVLYRRE
jgi:hypothetical protein